MDQLIGKMIDSYKILEVLGRGGMGVVYRAVDTKLDRDVAIKTMDVLIASDPNFLKRFQSEAKALAKLQNPNIVSIFALRETEFGVCIVMEFVKGKTLADVLKQSVLLPLPRVVNIFKQLLTALDHAHRGGVIHRDVKPGNVMLAEGDVVKVTDFGLAKIQKGPTSTMTMGTAGTLYYMSPEQIRGLGNVDHRGDIYSAGMALYESLTGRVPFNADDSDFVVAQIIVDGRIPPPDKMNPSLPKELVRIVMKSIDKDLTKRFQSAAEMATALERVGATFKPGDHRLSEMATVVSHAGVPVLPSKRINLPSRTKLYAGIGGGVAVLVITYFVVRPLVFPQEGLITVRTTPPNGQVFVDGTAAQKNPVESYDVPAGLRKITVRWGKTQIDTTVNVESGKLVTLLLAQRKPIETTQQVKEPPVSNLADLPSTKSDVQSTKTDEPVEPETKETHRGTLVLEAVPNGQVRVDNGSYREAGSGTHITVPAGMRRVTFKANNGTTKETEVRVGTGGTSTLKCYFSGTISVVSTVEGKSIWGTIVLDGARMEKTTPANLPLPVGRYRIGVTKQGYESIGGEQIVSLEPSLSGPPERRVTFKLKQR